MDALTPEQAQAAYDARLLDHLANGRALVLTEIDRIEQIEKRIRNEVNPRNGRQQLALIESYWSYQAVQLEAFLSKETCDA